MKKRLTSDQEFEIMKLVLDKFLWIGFIILVFGLYQLLVGTILNGVILMTVGALVLIIFLVLIVKEYEIIQ